MLTVKVKGGDITYTRKLNCTIQLDYQVNQVEHYPITMWDIEDALGDISKKTPYKTTTSSGMRIFNDDGNNTAVAKGYFTVKESGNYEIESFGINNSAFLTTVNGNSTKHGRMMIRIMHSKHMS